MPDHIRELFSALYLWVTVGGAQGIFGSGYQIGCLFHKKNMNDKPMIYNDCLTVLFLFVKIIKGKQKPNFKTIF